MSTAPTLPPMPLPYPWDYAYEWDGPMGARKFSPSERNGRKPARSVPVFTEAQVRSVAADHASALAQRVEELERQLAAAKYETRVYDQLLTHREQLLAAIPECPAHGQCVPHALEWVERAKAFERDLAAMTTARDVAVELGATYAARADELAREAMTWRNKHDEMRALLDSRPAINAGLVASYITWNGQCYQLDWLNARDAARDAARKGASL